MHYISLVRPQLVHAVIECPDSDVRKCKLAGLSLGNSSVPVALWRGSSLTVADETLAVDARGTYFTELTKNRKWGYACALFRSLVEELKETRPGVGRFGKLTVEQRRKLRLAADKAEKVWRTDTQEFKQELCVLGPKAYYFAYMLKAPPPANPHVVFDMTPSEAKKRFWNKRIKHLIMHGYRAFYTSDSSDAQHKLLKGLDDLWTVPAEANRHNPAAWESGVTDAIAHIHAGKWVAPDKIPARDIDSRDLNKFVLVASGVNLPQKTVSAPKERIEAEATFKLSLNSRLFMTPQYIADLVSDVKGDGQDLTHDDLTFGGFFRYGLNLARYSDFQQSKHELAAYYGLKQEGVNRIFAFHENARKLILKIPTVTRASAQVLLAHADHTGKTNAADAGWCRSESERYTTAAAMTALLHIGLGYAADKDGNVKDPLLNYIGAASEFFDLAHEFGVENLAESTFVTDTKVEADVKTFYDESTDSDFYGDGMRDGESLSAVDQATDEWMRRLKRVFDDTEETY
jgi:hypothetical protein